jgi:surface protein
MAITILKEPANPLFAKNEIAWKVQTNLTGVKLVGHLFVEGNHGDEDWEFVKKYSIVPDADGVAWFFAEKTLDTGALSYQRPSVNAEATTKSLICRNIRWEFYEEAPDDLVLLHTFFHSGTANKLIQFANVPDEATYLLRLYYNKPSDISDTIIGFGTTGSPPSGVNFPEVKDDAWQLGSDFILYQDILLDVAFDATLNTLLLPPFVKAELYAWDQPTTTLSSIRYALKGGRQLRQFAPVAGPPAAPSAFTVTATAPGQLSLDWTDNSSGLATFEIQRSIDGITYSALTTKDAGVTTHINTGLDDNTQYYYRIRADLSGTTSAWVTANGTTLNPFRLTVKTDNAGTSASNQFAMPLVSGGTYNFNVWYDGAIIKTGTTHTDNVITFADGAGTKNIAVTGTLVRWAFNNGGDRQKMITVSNWGIFNHGSQAGAFYGCANMNVTATDSPILTGSTTIEAFFRGCSTLTYNSSVANWDVSAITNFQNVWASCTLFNIDFSDWDTSSATNFAGIVQSCVNFNQPMNNLNVSNVTTMLSAFQNCTIFNQPLDNWNVGNVTNMNLMFRDAIAFNQNIGGWNVSKVTNFSSMFFGAATNMAFNNGGSADINDWNTVAATNMSTMFERSLFNQNISSWNVGNVTNMNRMFTRCPNFNQNISSWNVSKVTNFERMFELATAFNHNIGSWNTSAATNMLGMFISATAFNQNISGWNTEKVTTFNQMFSGATAFNQNLGSWDVISRAGRTTINMGVMLNNCGMNTANYDSTLVGWEAQTPVSAVTLGAEGRTYTAAGAGGTARASLISTYGWTITDAGGV